EPTPSAGFRGSGRTRKREGLLSRQRGKDALCKIPQPGSIRGIRRGGGRLQDHLRPAPKVVRHALDRPGRECHHRTEVLSTQWSLGRVLGIPSGELISLPTNLAYAPRRLRHCPLNPKGVLCRVEMAAQ